MRVPGVPGFAIVVALALSTSATGSPSSAGGQPRQRVDPASHLGLAGVDVAAVEGAATIRVALDRSLRGTFIALGAISDAGVATARRMQVGRRVRLTETLRGASGTIVIRVIQRCGKATSTWRIVQGSSAYAGLMGAGTGRGVIGCGGPRRSIRAVYEGAIRTSPASRYAEPGAYGGWTSQNERVTFDVLPDGRRVTNVRIERLVATCDPPLTVVLEPALLATYPIAPDGSFTAEAAGSTVTGRFDDSSAAGTIEYASTELEPYSCRSGSVTWTASSPPPPLPSALPGAYCGSTAQMRGICLILTAEGKVTQLRIEASIDCFQPETAEFETVIGFGGMVPLRSNLSFDVQGSLEGDAGGEYSLRGVFDSAGTASGNLSLRRVSFDQEGTAFACRDASFGWSANRLG